MGKSLGIAWLGAVTLTGAICPKAGYTNQVHLGRLSCLHLFSSEIVPVKVMEILPLEILALNVGVMVVWGGGGV